MLPFDACRSRRPTLICALQQGDGFALLLPSLGVVLHRLWAAPRVRLFFILDELQTARNRILAPANREVDEPLLAILCSRPLPPTGPERAPRTPRRPPILDRRSGLKALAQTLTGHHRPTFSTLLD